MLTLLNPFFVDSAVHDRKETVMPTSRLARAAAAAALLLTVVACGTTSVDPSRGFLEIRPGSFILTAPGDEVTLTAAMIDPSGTRVAVDVTWHTSAPDVVVVSDAGTATATGAIGSAIITATAEGLSSNPVVAIVAEPIAGARLVADDDVLEGPNPVDPDAELDLGWRHQAVLATASELAVGDLVIGTGAIAIGGRVVAVAPANTGALVTLEVVPLEELFVSLVIDQTVDLSDVRLDIDDELLTDYRVRHLADGSVEFVPRAPTVPGTAAQRAQSTGTRALGPFACEANGALTLTLAAQPSFNVTPQLGFVLTYDLESGGLQRLGVQGSVHSTIAVEPKVAAALAGSWKCEVELGVIPIPLGGPIAFVVGGQIPIGAGFELGAEVVLADAGFKVEAQGSAGVEMGIACTADECDPYAEGTGTFSASVTPNFPDFGDDGRFKASIKPYAFADAAVGTRMFRRLRMQLVRLELAAEQAFDLATARAQAADAAYASTFDLKLTLKATLGSGITRAMRLLKVTIKPFSKELVNVPLARSPRGTFSITPASAKVGDTVTFGVTLDPITYLGGQAVQAVEIHRRVGDGASFTLTSGPTGCATVTAAAGQSTVSCDVELQQGDVGSHTYYAFVRPRLLGVALPIPLEIAPDSSATLEVDDDDEDDEPALSWTFDTDLEGWIAGTTDGPGWGTAEWRSWCGSDRPRGCVILDGTGGPGEPNAWIWRTLELPDDITTLRFDTTAHNRDGADSLYRVRLMDGNSEHVLVPWTSSSGAEDQYSWHTITVSLTPFAGRTVSLYFEGADNGPGVHEQRYYDNISIE